MVSAREKPRAWEQLAPASRKPLPGMGAQAPCRASEQTQGQVRLLWPHTGQTASKRVVILSVVSGEGKRSRVGGDAQK